ncbi:hypothetical protein EVAR_88469_1 [Eumeta japonica]|uniref:Uncharacterized protein n=1 Tax=Eumeta variegata TaxID=151549 RepID=A0A4C1XVS8_EUMVA|nr:hypothetical protein EVAR_88469_1 [Eumeta japonica]
MDVIKHRAPAARAGARGRRGRGRRRQEEAVVKFRTKSRFVLCDSPRFRAEAILYHNFEFEIEELGILSLHAGSNAGRELLMTVFINVMITSGTYTLKCCPKHETSEII